MRFEGKKKQKGMDYNFMSKNGVCSGRNEKQKVKIHKKQTNYINHITETLSLWF